MFEGVLKAMAVYVCHRESWMERESREREQREREQRERVQRERKQRERESRERSNKEQRIKQESKEQRKTAARWSDEGQRDEDKHGRGLKKPHFLHRTISTQPFILTHQKKWKSERKMRRNSANSINSPKPQWAHLHTHTHTHARTHTKRKLRCFITAAVVLSSGWTHSFLH